MGRQGSRWKRDKQSFDREHASRQVRATFLCICFQEPEFFQSSVLSSCHLLVQKDSLRMWREAAVEQYLVEVNNITPSCPCAAYHRPSNMSIWALMELDRLIQGKRFTCLITGLMPITGTTRLQWEHSGRQLHQ